MKFVYHRNLMWTVRIIRCVLSVGYDEEKGVMTGKVNCDRRGSRGAVAEAR